MERRRTGAPISAVINSPSLGIDAPLSSGNIEKFNNDINFSYLGDNIRWKNPEEKKTTKKWRGCYAAGIRNFDRTFGDLHGLLDNGGYLKNTIVVLTSDHGEELMDHGEWEHGYTLFEEQIHVPLMIKLPGSDKGGKITEICGLVDILPTLTDLTRVTTKKLTLQGRSLKMFLDHRKPGGEKNYFSSGVKNDPEMRSIQNARYKLITNSPAGSVSLFDLKEDPKELINIAEKNRPLKNKMLQKLGNHLRDLNRFPSLLEESTPIPDSLLEQLRSLGYLH
jgi:arylsulfatase A-like enzyme